MNKTAAMLATTGIIFTANGHISAVNAGVKQKAWLCSNFKTAHQDPNCGTQSGDPHAIAPRDTASGAGAKHAINTKGTGSAGGRTPAAPANALKTRTKSNNSNE